MLSQLVEFDKSPSAWRKLVQVALNALKNMRFLDPEPEAMRQPSTPGQTVLSDRGENLAAVLHAIASDPDQKATFIEWLHELTPMDASDFEFPADPTGRILLTLVEASGQKTSAYSASDGTLRFLAMLAALLGPQPAHFYFFEELEAGIHPTRLRLLLSLLEQRGQRGDVQVVATTHSPQLLLLVEPATLEHVALTYRLENQPDTRIKKLLDLPNARYLVETQDVARLHDSGWLEDAAAFADEEDIADSAVVGEDTP
jgi:predicted ATPase